MFSDGGVARGRLSSQLSFAFDLFVLLFSYVCMYVCLFVCVPAARIHTRTHTHTCVCASCVVHAHSSKPAPLAAVVENMKLIRLLCAHCCFSTCFAQQQQVNIIDAVGARVHLFTCSPACTHARASQVAQLERTYSFVQRTL